MISRLLASFAGLALACPAVPALAQDFPRWYFQTSVFTKHYSPDPRHDNTQRLLNLEYQRADRWIFGGALFDNSFSQPSQYLYFGRIWYPFESYPRIYTKLTGGLLHGYKGEFRDKIPFNGNGIAPAALPSIGVSGKRFAGELVLFGTAGMMATVGFFF